MPRKPKAEKTEHLKPEADKKEAPSELEEQLQEPTVEPVSEPIGDSGVEAQGSKEEINEDVAAKALPKRRLPPLHDSDKDAEGCHCYDSTFPKGKLPPPPVLQRRELEDDQKPRSKQGKDGFDKAMEQLDTYYEGVPLRDPRFDQTRED